MRWGENETLQFSKCYLRQEILWNPAHADYKSKHKRNAAFKEVIAEFYVSTGIKLNDVEARVKVKNLRSTYCQEKKKIRVRSDDKYKYTPALKWFNAWDKAFSSKSRGRYSDTCSDSSTQQTTEEEFTISNENNSDSSTFVQVFEPEDDYKLFMLKPEPTEPTTKEIVNKRNKKKKRHSSVESMDNSYRCSVDSNLGSGEDEFDIYGKYIATQLRKMKLQQALRVQLAIQNLVSEARISDVITSDSL